MSEFTNCGGFPETFSPTDQNNYGHIADFEKAIHIKKHKTIDRIN